MSRNPFEEQAKLSALFAVERNAPPEADDVRERVLGRARAALAHRASVRLYRTMAPRRLRIGTAAAAAVVLIGFCAAAFRVGYRFQDRNVAALVASHPAMASVDEAPVLQGSSVAPAAPTSTEPERPARHFPTSRAPRVPTPSESYVAELSILQPALDAIAEHNFSAALIPIANHGKKFPSGQLAEEREGLRVKALVGLGRMSEATRVATAFHARFPSSALAGQIEELVGTVR